MRTLLINTAISRSNDRLLAQIKQVHPDAGAMLDIDLNFLRAAISVSDRRVRRCAFDRKWALFGPRPPAVPASSSSSAGAVAVDSLGGDMVAHLEKQYGTWTSSNFDNALLSHPTHAKANVPSHNNGLESLNRHEKELADALNHSNRAIKTVTIVEGVMSCMRLARLRAIEYSRKSFQFLLRKPLNKDLSLRLVDMVSKIDAAREAMRSDDALISAVAIRENFTLLFSVKGSAFFPTREFQTQWHFHGTRILHPMILELPDGEAEFPLGYRGFAELCAYTVPIAPVRHVQTVLLLKNVSFLIILALAATSIQSDVTDVEIYANVLIFERHRNPMLRSAWLTLAAMSRCALLWISILSA
jgi:hypothetical protein